MQAGLEEALEGAVRAAREAAALLEAEFFRPGGPRGPDGKCPADVDAERVIRRTLLGAFPDFGFTGEEEPERDRTARDGDANVWVVDPNDGTADFQRGRRGASVSIALLRGGVPVLGVVLAHSAPHGGEDLVTWAEGLGPVRRNGAPAPPLVDAPLAPGDAVLVSSHAPSCPVETALTVAPGRFLPLTSIAYRLALVAVGDARGAVSLNHPRALDYAGGHALLRGAGAAFLNERGEKVRYGHDGSGRARWCFAGPPQVAAELARRSWGRVAAAARLKPPAWVNPVPGAALRDAGLLARAQGAILGQLAGDALGSQVEFERADAIAARFPGGVRDLRDGGTFDTIAGQPTDDSEMALALARALVSEGRFDAGAVADAYAEWCASSPFDIGGTTRAALEPAARVYDEGLAGDAVAEAARAAALPDRKANGALMRVSPLGVFGHASRLEDVLRWAREDARLTHPNAVCLDASGVYAAAIAFAVREGARPAAVADFADEVAARTGAHVEVRDALRRARTELPDFDTHPGLVTVALQNAFFQLRHAPTLEDAVVETVGRGADTDTNAAIAGALLGAVYGVRAIPLRWRAGVLSCWPAGGAPGVRRPRPSACWPGDALVIAERLAAVHEQA